MGEGRNVHTFTTRESYAEMYCYYITKQDTINQTVTAVQKKLGLRSLRITK